MTEVPSGFGIQGTLVETTQTTALPSPRFPVSLPQLVAWPNVNWTGSPTKRTLPRRAAWNNAPQSLESATIFNN